MLKSSLLAGRKAPRAILICLDATGLVARATSRASGFGSSFGADNWNPAMLPDSDAAVAREGVMDSVCLIDGDSKELALLMKALSTYFESGGSAYSLMEVSYTNLRTNEN